LLVKQQELCTNKLSHALTLLECSGSKGASASAWHISPDGNIHLQTAAAAAAAASIPYSAAWQRVGAVPIVVAKVPGYWLLPDT
jgi:hypothetical protein